MTTYVPILKWKQGERTALLNLSAAGRTHVVPHISVGEAQFGSKGKKAPPPASEHFVKQVVDAWGTTPVFLDASALTGSPSHHTLDDIRAKAKAAGVVLIPSMRFMPSKEYSAAVLRAAKQDKRGIGFRISLAEMTSAASWATSWPVPLNETDLIVDLGDSVANVFALGASVHSAFASLHGAGSWRTVTICGGNIPATLSGYAVGCTKLPRRELDLWKQLTTKGLPYALDYGDYTTIGPNAITEGIEGPVPINAKYTLKDEYAVFHGVKIKGPGAKTRDVQYRDYAKQITKMPNRGALAHCWGDTIIDAIANDPTASPGSPASWVSYSVNRHIELTRTQLP